MEERRRREGIEKVSVERGGGFRCVFCCVLSSHRVASKLPRVNTSCNPRWMRATARVTLRVTNVGPVRKEEGGGGGE